MKKKNVSIIGGGPAAFTTAFFLSSNFDISIYEKEKSIGQKFLVAGKGGFNLTNTLSGDQLADQYSPKNFLHEAILNFDSEKVRSWLFELGISTFVGTSGRVYADEKYKPYEVLEAIKDVLTQKGVGIFTNNKFVGFDESKIPLIESKNKRYSVKSDYYIFALGGASWTITGSDGKWLNYFNSLGIKTVPFKPSNCGININWPKNILEHHIGKPVKNANLIVKDKRYTGEAVLTDYGLEGNLIYSAIPEIRELLESGETTVYLDLKPNNSINELIQKASNTKLTSTNYKKVLNLNSTELAILKYFTSKNDFLQINNFVRNIKRLKIKVESLRPIEEAISSVGGIDIDELNPDFSLKQYPNIFIIGEMADWDAPTGGFLLQACFSMGKLVAEKLSRLP